jgi:hypothetical protein
MLFDKTAVTSNNLTIWFLRENTVFHNEGDSKATSKQDILLLVAQEFAHFWFVNFGLQNGGAAYGSMWDLLHKMST